MCDLFGFWCPHIHIRVSYDNGKNIMGCQWICLGHCVCQSWDLSSLLVMWNYGQYLGDFFLIPLQKICSHSHQKQFPLFLIFYNVFLMCINKMSSNIGILHRTDVVIWVNKADLVHFILMGINCSFGSPWS